MGLFLPADFKHRLIRIWHPYPPPPNKWFLDSFSCSIISPYILHPIVITSHSTTLNDNIFSRSYLWKFNKYYIWSSTPFSEHAINLFRSFLMNIQCLWKKLVIFFETTWILYLMLKKMMSFTSLTIFFRRRTDRLKNMPNLKSWANIK